MTIYTFYPTSAGGLAASFEAFDLPDDKAALERAERVLDEHASARAVVVWEGSRQVAARHRAEHSVAS